jgi:hypothetical protein
MIDGIILKLSMVHWTNNGQYKQESVQVFAKHLATLLRLFIMKRSLALKL